MNRTHSAFVNSAISDVAYNGGTVIAVLTPTIARTCMRITVEESEWKAKPGRKATKREKKWKKTKIEWCEASFGRSGQLFSSRIELVNTIRQADCPFCRTHTHRYTDTQFFWNGHCFRQKFAEAKESKNDCEVLLAASVLNLSRSECECLCLLLDTTLKKLRSHIRFDIWRVLRKSVLCLNAIDMTLYWIELSELTCIRWYYSWWLNRNGSMNWCRQLIQAKTFYD